MDLKTLFPKSVVLGLCGYFLIFGLIFLFNPSMSHELGVHAMHAAGVTEIRVYYGALSIALGIFFSLLVLRGERKLALLGGCILCGMVVSSRTIMSFVDQSFGEAYTQFAIPAEVVMFLVLAAAYRLTSSK